MTEVKGGSTRVAMRSGSTLYFLLSDHPSFLGTSLGSTTMFLNSSGKRISELMYKTLAADYSRGENRFTYGLVPSTFQYTGQRNEPSVAGGLYYYGARYFDSAIGRFISADTAVPDQYDSESYDRYAYVRNNPINRIDPTGHRDEGPGEINDLDQIYLNQIERYIFENLLVFFLEVMRSHWTGYR